MRKIENENGYIFFDADDMNSDDLVIEKVEAYEKRKGTGTQLVKQVIQIAQEEDKGLTLCAYPQDDSIELSALVKFYEKLGFSVEYDDGSEVLMRY